MNEVVQNGIFRPYPHGEGSNGGTNNTQYNNNPKSSENSGSENGTLSSNYLYQSYGSNSSIVNDANKCAIIKRIYSIPNRKNSANRSKKGGVQCGSSRNTTNTQPTSRVNHTNTLDEQLRFSTNTLPTDLTNHIHGLDEQLRFSTNTLPNGCVNRTNLLDEQLRFTANTTLLTGGVKHTNVLGEQSRFMQEFNKAPGDQDHLNSAQNRLVVGTLGNHQQNNVLINNIPGKFSYANETFAQGPLRQSMLPPLGRSFQNHSFGSSRPETLIQYRHPFGLSHR